MSAKNRKRRDGEQAEKPASEFYPTPAWATQRLLQHVDLRGGHWLEPSAGDGAIIRAARSVRDDVRWFAVELRDTGVQLLRAGASDVLIGNFLDPHARTWLEGRTSEGISVTLGNPPFSLAAPFVMRALEISDVVVMLLRLNFLGSSANRRHLFDSAGMPDVYVLPERPSFTGEGTDATEYGWFLWRADKSQRGEVRILWDTSQGSLFASPNPKEQEE
jgi:hypothetical protein